MKIAAAGLQAPPGYLGADGGLQGSIGMRAAYGGYSRHGDHGNCGHQHTGACGDHHAERRGGGDIGGAAGQPAPPRSGFPAGRGLAGADPHIRCHCDHVDRLLVDMGAAQNDIRRLQTTRTPLIPPEPQPQQPQQPQQHGNPPDNDQHGAQASHPMELPLALGHLGNISSDRIFDDKVSVHEDFRFNWHKNGYAWKSKIERYMISRIPALAKIFYWAERQEVEITDELLRLAIGNGLTIYDRDGTPRDYTNSLNSAVWGFLNNCITGDALVMLEQAEVCAGLDAWRRIIRLIDSGRTIRLEQLRNEMRSIRAYPIRNLEGVTVGVAAFENKIKEYVEAGGRKPPEDEMKSDLNAILPAELGDHLTVRVSDPQQSYAVFRDFVVYTCAQLLMRRKKLPINALGGPSEEGGNGDDQAAGSVEQLDELYLNALSDIHAGRGGTVDQLDEWYFGALGNIRSKGLQNRGRKGGGKGGKGSGKNSGQGGLARLNALKERSGLKCQNCHGDNMMSECKKPMLDKSQRTCFTCGGDHLAASCPNKRPPLKAVTNDISKIPFYNVND